MISKEIIISDTDQIIEVLEDTEFSAIYIGKSNTSMKSKIQFLHKKPNLKSRIHIKSIVFDNAKFDFEGVLKIERGASATDTYLKIDCLIVGENAYARAIPSLEILESEVKGGHGATIGYIDQTQLNYLYSKGLDKNRSERLIIDAFMGKAD